MNRVIGLGAAIALALAAIVGLSSIYTVGMTEQALLLQFGKPVGVVTEPGLHFKLPFVQDVQYIPKLLLNLDAPPEEVIAQDKKRMVVDAFARYRVIDPLRFYQALKDERTAALRLTPILSSNVRRVLGSQTFSAVLSAKRAVLMRDISNNVNQDAADFGIKVVDVRIRRADLPTQNSEAIYKRMQKEREREASEFRAEGAETKQRIMARADREVTVLTAEATRESEILRGQGDAEKTRILGDAYNQDQEFFSFYRSMQAYQDAFQPQGTTMVLSPNGEFFRYFGDAGQGNK